MPTKPLLGQIWTYVYPGSTCYFKQYDQTVRLIAKNLCGDFEYMTLLGNNGMRCAMSIHDLNAVWTYDPEAKGSDFYRKEKEK